ncbi:MAG TPA: hypothetical protein VFW41_08260 [Gaiellaceae bacterium]|jgi:hypothetical protein|nr:hypothetical protein [Gaiellaceae bacterium]
MDLIASFLAGSLLSLLLPVGLLAAVLIWWGTILRRRSGGDA